MADNLKPEEEALVKSLLAANKGDAPIRFSWDDNFQRRLLALLLADTYFLIQAQSLIKPEYFTNESHVIACKCLFELFAKYKSLPEKFILLQFVKEEIKGRDDAIKMAFTAEVESVYDFYTPGLTTREVLLDRLMTFSRAQSTRIAFAQCQKMILERPEEEKTWSEVDEILRQALVVNRGMDVGFEYFLNIEEMFRRMNEMKESGERFTTGVNWIDERITGGSPKRGALYAWIGLPGRGKSILLAQAATENIKLGHNVVYLSLEMDDIEVAERITAQFTQSDINFLWDKREDITKEIETRNKSLEFPNNLVIRQFPGGTIDVNFIRAYVAHLKLSGFKPDLLIVDYAGELKEPPDVPTWEAKYRIMRDLRATGIMENMMVMTAVQPNKSAAELEKEDYIDESNIGGSFDQFKPLDGFWSINQLDAEKQASVGRIFIIKHRSGKSREATTVDFKYETMTISVISKDHYHKRMNSVADQQAANIDLDSGGKMGGKKGKKPRQIIYQPNEEDTASHTYEKKSDTIKASDFPPATETPSPVDGISREDME